MTAATLLSFDIVMYERGRCMSELQANDKYYDIESDDNNISVVYEYEYREKFMQKQVLNNLSELVIWVRYNGHLTLYQESTNIASNFKFLKSGGHLIFFKGEEIVAIVDSKDLSVEHMLEKVDEV